MTRVTFEAYVEEYFAWRKESGAKFVVTDHARVRKHAVPLLGRLPMNKITREHLESLAVSIADSSLSPKSKRNCWGVIIKMFEDASTSTDARIRWYETKQNSNVNPAYRVNLPQMELTDRYQYGDGTYTIKELAAIACVDLACMRNRLRSVSVEEAMLRPDRISARFTNAIGETER